MSTIAIVGLGLIGGSLGLDFTRQGHRVLGISRRLETAEAAIALAAVAQAGTELALVAEADVVFLCTPIDQMVGTARLMRPYLRQGTVVTDVGSVKQIIVEEITALWPDFVGGHPMAGKAEAGLAAAQGNLFRHRPYVITPTAQTQARPLAVLTDLVQQLGAEICQCHPHAHDLAVAWISHLPVMVSSSLIQACQQEPDEAILALAQTLASSGFQDTSRVGGGVPELGTLMARYNRPALLSSLESYQQQLQQLIHLIQAQDWQGLEQYLAAAQLARSAYLP
ncbi:MAG: prephenate/arogenate dehydrogenase [Cyanobacteria bacterium REEB459]|nr:prephenate/arogenate dehydrogenase [Cyanobacteria bacterium REEB459]